MLHRYKNKNIRSKRNTAKDLGQEPCRQRRYRLFSDGAARGVTPLDLEGEGAVAHRPREKIQERRAEAKGVGQCQAFRNPQRRCFELKVVTSR